MKKNASLPPGYFFVEKMLVFLYNGGGEAMKDKKIKKIPYGVTDYDRIIKKNCYYVDKTMYLAEIENAGDYLFFIRPRRFGKSLFASVMEGYYDVYYKDRFEELFKDNQCNLRNLWFLFFICLRVRLTHHECLSPMAMFFLTL
jgi:hypothetical protein